MEEQRSKLLVTRELLAEWGPGECGRLQETGHLLNKGGEMDGESRWRVEVAKEVCSRIWS